MLLLAELSELGQSLGGGDANSSDGSHHADVVPLVLGRCWWGQGLVWLHHHHSKTLCAFHCDEIGDVDDHVHDWSAGGCDERSVDDDDDGRACFCYGWNGDGRGMNDDTAFCYSSDDHQYLPLQYRRCRDKIVPFALVMWGMRRPNKNAKDVKFSRD